MTISESQLFDEWRRVQQLIPLRWLFALIRAEKGGSAYQLALAA